MTRPPRPTVSDGEALGSLLTENRSLIASEWAGAQHSATSHLRDSVSASRSTSNLVAKVEHAHTYRVNGIDPVVDLTTTSVLGASARVIYHGGATVTDCPWGQPGDVGAHGPPRCMSGRALSSISPLPFSIPPDRDTRQTRP